MAAINPFTVIGSALASHLGSAGTIRFYQDLAPGTAIPPYGIFSYQAGIEDYKWGSEEVDTRYQIKIVSNREWAGEAMQLYGETHRVVQFAPLNVGGSVSLLRCQRETPIKYQDPKKFWHVGGIYRIEIIGEG